MIFWQLKKIQLPNMLIFKENKTVNYYSFNSIYEAPDILEEEKRLEKSRKIVEEFIEYPDRRKINTDFIMAVTHLVDVAKEQMGIMD